jgi:hypothetical protein
MPACLNRTHLSRFKRIVPALLIAAAMSGAMPAAQPREEWRRYRDLLRQGNYLGALRLLDQAPWQEGNVPPEDLSRLFGLQIVSEVLGAVGRCREAQEAFNRREARPQPPAPPPAETLKAVRQVPLEPAEQMVLRAVKEHQIVILNETHYQPEHRAFGARLISRLQALGVRYFALETDAQAPLDAAMQTGRVRLDTDPYSWEPQRAELLRAVLRAGMKLVAFDLHTPEEQAALRRDPIGAIPIREAAMARSIDEQILQRDHAAKVLIWVGMGHACKQPLDVNGEKQAFMALQCKAHQRVQQTLAAPP